MLILIVLVWIKFGIEPILFIAVGLVALYLWSRLSHPKTWRTTEYTVKVLQGFREEAWVQYIEAGNALSLRAGWSGNKKDGVRLVILMDDKVYFPPDYKNQLSELRVAEIKNRVSESPTHLKIQHTFEQIAAHLNKK
jgi:hypothetical protein